MKKLNKTELTELKNLIEAWQKTGRAGFHYRKLRQVALNGGRRRSEFEALEYLPGFFNV